MWPLSPADTPPLFTHRTYTHTATHRCGGPNYIFLSIPLVFQGVNCWSKIEECDGSGPTLCVCVSGAWVCISTANPRPHVRDACGRYGNVWINVSQPHLAVRFSRTWSRRQLLQLGFTPSPALNHFPNRSISDSSSLVSPSLSEASDSETV